MSATIPVLDNPLFGNQTSYAACPPDYPWFRGQRCWRRHSFDTPPDSTDSVDPLPWWPEWYEQQCGHRRCDMYAVPVPLMDESPQEQKE